MPETVSFLIGFIAMYTFTLLASTLLTALPGDGSMLTNFSAALTCVSNVGPGFDAVGPTCNFAFYSAWSKIVLSLTMIAGRLELSTFFIIFSRFFWDSSKV